MMRNKSRKYIASQKENYRPVFDYILSSVESVLDVNKPLRITGGDHYDLTNPYGVAACLVCYFYSIEPPFYAYLNRAINGLDEK